jgi:ATP-dependent RNA helicase DDX35
LRIRRKRIDLRIIISSATIDAETFKNFFESGREKEDVNQQKEITSVISLEGRTYPVDIMYLDEPTEDYIEKALKTVLDIHLRVSLLLKFLITLRNLKAISFYF